MNKDEFDNLFDDAFADAARKHLPTPDPDESWAKLEPKLKARLAKKKIRFMPYALTASFLLGALIFGSPTASKAYNPFLQTIKQIQEGVVSFIFGNDTEHNGKAKTAPPPDHVVADEGQVIDYGVLTEQHFGSWEEAASQLVFPAPDIGHVPASFKLTDVLVFSRGEQKAKKAVLIYENESEAKTFMVTMRMLEQNETITTGSDINAGKYEMVQVRGQPGFLFLTRDGRSSLDYMFGNTVISISGALTKDEIMKIAENIQ